MCLCALACMCVCVSVCGVQETETAHKLKVLYIIYYKRKFTHASWKETQIKTTHNYLLDFYGFNMLFVLLSLCFYWNLLRSVVWFSAFVPLQKGHTISYCNSPVLKHIFSIGCLTCGVTVSMSAFLACHQCSCAGSSLAWGLHLRALVYGIF